ncbi:hypothetical protein QCM80_46100, partial [Bradyrhizobium sp. SSUT112]|uniref:hypothetical protein n=1 Tax=Bradyrhizobium sp. SSUT112 TaxID=3040604 RepID=UPI002447081E
MWTLLALIGTVLMTIVIVLGLFKAAGLGSVEIQDSQIGTSVIQAPKGVLDAAIRFDGRPVGEDAAALF